MHTSCPSHLPGGTQAPLCSGRRAGTRAPRTWMSALRASRSRHPTRPSGSGRQASVENRTIDTRSPGPRRSRTPVSTSCATWILVLCCSAVQQGAVRGSIAPSQSSCTPVQSGPSTPPAASGAPGTSSRAPPGHDQCTHARASVPFSVRFCCTPNCAWGVGEVESASVYHASDTTWFAPDAALGARGRLLGRPSSTPYPT